MAGKVEAILNTPPVVLTGATVLGFSLADLNSIMGMTASFVVTVYTLALLYFRLRKEWTKRKEGDEHD